MKLLLHRTKIVATIGPASDSPDVIQKMLLAGMNVARLNFSHGNYQEHTQRIERLRSVAAELDLPLLLLQDLQGPKIRVGDLPGEGIFLKVGDFINLVPIAEVEEHPNSIGIDYPYVAEEAELGTQILLDDGLLELRVEKIDGNAVCCQVIEGRVAEES